MKESDKARKWFESINGLCDFKENRERNSWCVKKEVCKKIICKD